jgi:hypothetical protein
MTEILNHTSLANAMKLTEILDRDDIAPHLEDKEKKVS